MLLKKTKLIKLINKKLVNEKSNSSNFKIINGTISNCSNGDNINILKINLKNKNYKQQINSLLLQIYTCTCLKNLKSLFQISKIIETYRKNVNLIFKI